MEDYAKYTTIDRNFEIVALNAQGVKERYKSKFLKVGEGFYLISIPTYKNNVAILRAGDSISLYLYTPEGIYNLKCNVLEVYEKYYKISFAKNFNRVQRREYVRVNLRVPMKVTVDDGTTYNVTTNNLSARGCGFYFQTDLSTNDKISLTFKVSGKTVRTFANVVSSKLKNFSSGPKYVVALNFTSVTQANIDLIIKECFMYQARQRLAVLDSAYDTEE